MISDISYGIVFTIVFLLLGGIGFLFLVKGPD
jgi:hypothetical protein